jgi:hypothetical protein
LRGFQFAIARLPIALAPEAERMLAMYLQTITAAADAVKRARAIADASKRDRRRPQHVHRREKNGQAGGTKVQPAGDPIC